MIFRETKTALYSFSSNTKQRRKKKGHLANGESSPWHIKDSIPYKTEISHINSKAQ